MVGLQSAPSGAITCSSAGIEFDGESGVMNNTDLRGKEQSISAWDYLDVTGSCLEVE